MEHLRTGEWSESNILTREKYDIWQKDGSRTVVEKASEMVDELTGMEDVYLDESKREMIDALIEDFEHRQCS
jgi:trimethylamine:corrinoid methyltransferase-like protein